MDEPLDLSFYLGKQYSEQVGNLDVPLGNGEIVSINLVDELPEDPNELISFLETENCSRKYWISIAIAYAKKDSLGDSLEVIKRALSLSLFSDEDKSYFHSFLSWLHLKYVSRNIDKENNINLASEEINKVSGNNPLLNISTLLSKAVLSLYKDQVDVALDIFDKLLKLEPNNCFALLGKAQVLLNKTKSYSRALKLYQQVLILKPTMSPDPRIGIGLCAWFLKDEKMAIQAWERCMELNPKNSKAQILLTLAKFNNTFNGSLSDEDFIENYTACLKTVAEKHKEDPNDIVILFTLLSYYFSKENYDVIEKLVNKIIGLLTGNSDGYKTNSIFKSTRFCSNSLSDCLLWLGRVSFIRGDFTQSQKHFHESIKLNENNLLAKLGLGQSQISRGSIEEAIITFESILKTNSKCLEVNYSLGLLYSQQKSKRKQDLAIQVLERYLRLSSNRGVSSSKNDEGLEFLNKEPIVMNAYLVLSKLYEAKDLNQSLTYLLKAIESRKQINQDAPLEVYNNIGVFNFIKNNYTSASENFKIALEKLEGSESFIAEDGDVLVDLPEDLKVSLTFNYARSQEVSDEDSAIAIYGQLEKEYPNYFSAKLRLLFLDCVSKNTLAKEEIKEEIEKVLKLHASNLEVRSFYGWFIKQFGKKLGAKPDADTAYQKETLVEYDSHDCYALISLANIYCIMAREAKSASQSERKKKYYIRAIELYAKVLSVDAKNVYAAQGLAIVYIENNDQNKGLDILRKIRDSLNDISVYLNLGHVLVDLKQFTKAIENYEIALSRYTDGKDSKILSFLGRAWYLRGTHEGNLFFLKKALEYSEEALEAVEGVNSSLKFNIAYIQFQVAEFITKMPIEHRAIDDIKEAIINLNSGIETLNSLTHDDVKHSPYPKADLKARASLGTSTLLNRLNVCLQETEENVQSIEAKLDEAKRQRQEELERKVKEEEEKLMARKLKEEELAKERAKLHEQAQKWAEEARSNIVEDEDDDKLFDKESNDKAEKKKKQKKKTIKKAKGKKGKKKAIEDSSEESAHSSSSDTDLDNVEGDNKNKRKNDVLDDEDEENEIKSKKKKFLSKETIEDSDEDLEDDLFGEENNGTNDPSEQAKDVSNE